MNDSFLDEVDLGHRHQVDQFITTRKCRSAGEPVQYNDFEFLTQENINTNADFADKKELRRKELINDQKKKITKQQELKKLTEHPLVETKLLDKKVKSLEKRGRLAETNRIKGDDLKTKNQELKDKVSDSRHISKEHHRRSGNSNHSSRTSDPSSKENILTDNVTPNRNAGSLKKIEVNELNAIKELVSSYTKQESTKILRAMQELHINSQANLIKQLLNQTEDLTREIHPSRDTSRLKKLVEENERMREDIIILKLRNEELQRKVDESILTKEENIALKLKIKELLKSGS